MEDNEKLTVLLLELGDPSAKYRDEDIENISIDINLLSRWDVSPNLNNESIDEHRTSERGLKALRKRCRELLTRLLTIVSLFCFAVFKKCVISKPTQLSFFLKISRSSKKKNFSKHTVLIFCFLSRKNIQKVCRFPLFYS